MSETKFLMRKLMLVVNKSRYNLITIKLLLLMGLNFTTFIFILGQYTLLTLNPGRD